MEKNDLNLDLQLCHKFYVASNAITRLYRPVLNELDLTYPSYLVMIVLWEQNRNNKPECLRISELSNISKIDLGALSLILKRLVSKKYVSILVDSSDQRKKIVSLTPIGQKLYKKAKLVPTKMSQYFEHMDEKDFIALSNLMSKMINNL